MTSIEELREYCLAKPLTSEELPFDDVTLVFKVAGKIFAITNLHNEATVNLKCDPDEALELRSQYEAVTPAYHQNKKHWNTVWLNGSIPSKEIRRMIDNSYTLVVQKMSKKARLAVGL